MKNKCEYIELCRFVGAIIILCHHSYTLMDRTIFLGGWAFVEFYFILTGYYTTSHFVKKMEKHKVEYDEMFFYVKSKIKKLYPYAVGGRRLWIRQRKSRPMKLVLRLRLKSKIWINMTRYSWAIPTGGEICQ